MTDKPSSPVFDAGPPPQLNTLKRLAQEVNAVSTELERARADDAPTAVGLKLAEKAEKSGGRDFRKSAAKKVDFDGEEKVFTSLLNLSLADGGAGGAAGPLAPRHGQKAKKDPELALEDYFTPYQGKDVCYTPASKRAVLDMVTGGKRAKMKSTRYRIQDECPDLLD